MASDNSEERYEGEKSLYSYPLRLNVHKEAERLEADGENVNIETILGRLIERFPQTPANEIEGLRERVRRSLKHLENGGFVTKRPTRTGYNTIRYEYSIKRKISEV